MSLISYKKALVNTALGGVFLSSFAQMG